MKKMKLYKLRILVAVLCTSLLFVQCGDDDDNGNVIVSAACDDGEQNGDEEGVDCGGSCEPCAEEAINFSGTYIQEDSMGRPGVNTVFSGADDVKNNFNTTTPSDRAAFQPTFQATLELYHDVYATSLEIDPADLDYETNILGLDAATFTTVLANFDALQVASEGPTSYFNSTTGLPLTGRNLTDDVIDISLILMFGGTSGTRFDGTNNTPQLTSDGVGIGTRVYGEFPYLETPN